MAFTFAASNSDEPPRAIIPPPSWFSSLPIDIVWNILARVPKRCHPILSCVSKNFRDLVRSPEIHRIRSLLGRESLYICLIDMANPGENRYWFTLRRVENDPTKNQFASVDIPFPYYLEPNPSVIAIGPEMYFICGSFIHSSSLFIFDTKSAQLRPGPSMKSYRSYNTVGLVGGRIYVIGGHKGDEDKAESFDLKMQTWKRAPNPERKGTYTWISFAAVSLDRKVYALSGGETATSVGYNTRDGSCEEFELPKDKWSQTGVCVIHNVLYVYYARFGLMWYDTKMRLWRVITGLNRLLKKEVQHVAMAEYYGKLAFLWKKSSHVSKETDEIWCRMIALDRSEVGIRGTAEASQLLGSVPDCYGFEKCLSVSD